MLTTGCPMAALLAPPRRSPEILSYSSRFRSSLVSSSLAYSGAAAVAGIALGACVIRTRRTWRPTRRSEPRLASGPDAADPIRSATRCLSPTAKDSASDYQIDGTLRLLPRHPPRGHSAVPRVLAISTFCLPCRWARARPGVQPPRRARWARGLDRYGPCSRHRVRVRRQ